MPDAESHRARSSLRRWLEAAPAPVFTAFAAAAAFSTYFCMYAFRKPFAVGRFPGTVMLPLIGALDLKTLYVVAQVLGYAASKFLGIKVVSEMPPSRRAAALVVTISVAEIALVLFGLAPAPFGALCLMLNGLALGVVWGLVFGFLEGRKVSDLLGVGLCASFIVASGAVKTVGKTVLDWGVSEAWMPAATGALFFPPLLFFVAMLSQVPPPTSEDERLRSRRAPMNGAARRAFFVAHAPGLVALMVAYVALTALRDFRDNFARELWDALGYADSPAIMTASEIPVAVGALAAVGLTMALKDNRRALYFIHGLMLFGVVIAAGGTLLYQLGAIGPAPWMIAVGLGLYIAYVPYNCVLFDRLVAALGSVATAGFLIYVADACGYAGSIALVLYKSLGRADLDWVPFLAGFTWVTAAACVVLFGLSAAYWWARAPGRARPAHQP
jgi:hypothetical protein